MERMSAGLAQLQRVSVTLWRIIWLLNYTCMNVEPHIWTRFRPLIFVKFFNSYFMYNILHFYSMLDKEITTIKRVL